MISHLRLLYYLLRSDAIFVRRTSHGLGDNLLLSAILPELRRQNPHSKIVVETAWPELFEHNPYPDWATDRHIKTTSRHIKPKYRVDETTTVSIYEQIMSYLGETEKGFPQLFLTPEEIGLVKQQFAGPYITICPTGKTTFCANRKEWGMANFQTLRDLLSDYVFVQVGIPEDPLLHNVVDARRLSVRETAAAIRNSLFFLGLEGGLMHLAKAVGQRSAVVYGGFIRPEVSSYQENVTVYEPVDCSPCFHSDYAHEPCQTMKCMKAISPEMVYHRIRGELLTTLTPEV